MWQRIRIWLRNFFGFSRSEANGFILLSFLMILVLSMPFLSRQLFYSADQKLQTDEDRRMLNVLLEKLGNTVSHKTKNNKVISFKSFDLNKSDAQHLINSGFPKYLAERIVKYRQKVRPFTSKSELLKIYGIDSSFYEKIYPFIQLTAIESKTKEKLYSDNPPVDKVEENKLEKIASEVKAILSFDINTVDSTQLQNIYGIGPTYSTRIIKYREFLGGYHSIDQLEEVYGLKKENLDSLKKHIYIKEKFNVKQLKVNQINIDSLVQHPYISYKEANLIINYRNQHGNFKSYQDLLSIKILDSAWVNKVSPYLSFE